MASHKQHRRSYLFMVRIWVVHMGDQPDVYGRVQHVQTGETRFFRVWSQLVTFIIEEVQEMEQDMG